jgi:hypothetical protein
MTQRLEAPDYCAHCGRNLWAGYRWQCHLCGETYCYAHMTRHSKHTAERISVPLS